MATTISASPRRTASPVPQHAPAPRRRPPLEVVRPRRGPRIGVIGAVGAVAVFAVLFGLVLFQTVMVQNQSRLDRLDTQIRDEQGRYQQLRLQVAQLESPARIVDEATHRLGMVPPPGTSYLTPSSTDAAAATAATAATAVAGPSTAAGDPTASDGLPDDSGSDWPTVKPYLGAAR